MTGTGVRRPADNPDVLAKRAALDELRAAAEEDAPRASSPSGSTPACVAATEQATRAQP